MKTVKIQIKTVLFLNAIFAILIGGSEKEQSINVKLLNPDTLPIPIIAAEESTSTIPVTQSSYCWGRLGCADFFGVLEGKIPTIVSPETMIKITFSKPAPNYLSLWQRQDDEKQVEVPLKKGKYFNGPKERGIYYYGLSAHWLTDNRKQSYGSTSLLFIIEVK